MSDVVVSAGQIGIEYVGPESSLVMRIYTPKGFTPSSGMAIVPGRLHTSDFYDEIPCSVVAGVVTHDGFTIDSTDDALSNPKNAYYTFYLYTTAGRPVRQVHARIYVPATPSPTTLADLATYSAASPANLGLLYYTAAQVNAIIAALVNVASKATEVIYGAVRLSVPAVSSAAPIVIGDNDPRVATLSSQYANSLATAVAAIGATETMLVVNAPTTVSANLTVPNNIRLVFTQTGRITIASARTLTIGLMDDPGNKRVFVQTDSTSNVRFSPGAVQKMNVAWFTGPTPTDCTQALNQIFASAAANLGGVGYLPEGTWTTQGNHTLPNNFILEGAGKGSSFGVEWTELKMITVSIPIFTITPPAFEIRLRDIAISGDDLAGVTGVLIEGAAGSIVSTIALENVHILKCVDGFYMNSTAGSLQMRQISMDAMSIISECTSACIRVNTLNCGIWCEATLHPSAGGRGVLIEQGGIMTFAGTEFGFAGIPSYPTPQSMTQTVVSPGGITLDGLGRSVVTAADLPNSPVTVLVPLTVAEHTTATLIATAFVNALSADPSVGSFFHVLQDGVEIRLVALDAAADDGTYNFTIEDLTSTGITDDVVAVKQTSGSTTSSYSLAAVDIQGEFVALNIIGCQEEGAESSLNIEGTGTIVIEGSTMQSSIRIKEQCTIDITGGTLAPKILRELVGTASFVNIIGARVPQFQAIDGDFRLVEQNPNAITGVQTLASLVSNSASGSRVHAGGQTLQMHLHAWQTDTWFFYPRDRGWMEIGSPYTDQILLSLGQCNESGKLLFAYNFLRNAAGRLEISGSQDLPDRGFDFNADIVATQFTMSETRALGTTGAVTMDCELSNRWTVTPTADMTINATNLVPGKKYYLTVLTSGAVSWNITFGTGFLGVPVLATGGVGGLRFVVEFYDPDGSNIIQLARTAAL